jgi:hypothetical protein
MASNQVQPALLFMPDISGFTQFVNETEIIHSQHIIKELLEILIEANQIELQVGEIEGDAIFFYKLCEKPGLGILLHQAEKMFTRFHQHLKLYDHKRICPCGACKTAVNLTLKIVAHFGEVTPIAVKEHKKLFGKDVILVHRLLKNNLDKKEYFLFTHSLSPGDAGKFPDWYQPQSGLEEYDLGRVPFSYSDLSALHQSVPELALPAINFLSKSKLMFSEEQKMEIPMDDLFNIMIEQLQRGSWITRKDKKDDPSAEEIYSIGARHVCLLTQDSTNKTESVKIEQDKIQLVEVSEKEIAGYKYVLRRISSTETSLTIEMLVKNNPLMKLGFNLFYKQGMKVKVHRFFERLGTYIKKNRQIAA